MAKGKSEQKAGKGGKGKKGDKKEGKGKKESPKKKNSPQDIAKAEEEMLRIFARKRYEEMDSIYKHVSSSGRITILLPMVHVWEEWSALPPIPQLCCSGEEVQSIWDKYPDKAKTEEGEVKLPFAYYKSCILRGCVYVKEAQLRRNECVYVEICARLRYNSNDLTDPLQPLLTSSVLDFREYRRLYPVVRDEEIKTTELIHRLVDKAKMEKFGVKPLIFQFDLSQRMDSIKFNRPDENRASGIVWEATAYINKHRHLRSDPDTATIEFCKYTYAPILSPDCPLRLSPVESSRRYSTPGDPGVITVEGKLPRDLFYHEDYIPVSVNVSNTSSRLCITCIIISVEQVIRTYKDTLQELNLLVAEEYIDTRTPQCGLPLTSKQKSWNRTVFLRPLLEAVKDKYNLLVEGRIRTEREYLASSTVLFTPDPADRELIYYKYVPPCETFVDESTGEMCHRIVYDRVELIDVMPPPSDGSDTKKTGKKGGKSSPKQGKKGKDKGKGKGKGKKNKNVSNIVDDVDESVHGENMSNKKGGGKSSPKKGKGKGKSPDKAGKEGGQKKTGPLPPLEKVIQNNIEYEMCNKDRHRSVFVSYDVVVRVNVSLPGGDGVGGHPTIRLPFVLTRKTTLNPLSHSGLPEGLFDPPVDPRQGGTSKKSSPAGKSGNSPKAGKGGKGGKKKGGKK